MIQPTPLQIPFSGGLREDIDSRLVEPPDFTTLKNITFLRNGSKRRRHGYRQVANNALSINLQNVTLPSAIATGNFKRLSQANSELLCHDGDYLYSLTASYAPSAVWTRVDRACPCSVYREPISGYSFNITTMDVAKGTPTSSPGSGYLITVYTALNSSASYGVFVTVKDIDTGNCLYRDYILSASAGATHVGARVAANGRYVMVCYQRNGTGNIYARSLDLDNPSAWSAETSMVVAAGTNGTFDLCAVDGAVNRFALVYQSTIAGSRLGTLVLAHGTPPTAITTTNQAEAITGQTAFAIASTLHPATGNPALYISYAQPDGGGNTDIRVFGVESDLATVFRTAVTASSFVTPGTAPNRMGVTVDDNGVMQIVLGIQATLSGTSPANTDIQIYWQSYTTQTNTAGQQFNQRSYELGSKPFTFNGRTYVQVYRHSTSTFALLGTGAGTFRHYQGTYYLADLTTDADNAASATKQLRPVARYAVNVANNDTVLRSTVVNNCPLVTTGKHVGLAAISGIDLNNSNVWQCNFDFNSSNNVGKGVQIGPLTYLSGGLPMVYDGRKLFEVGFNNYPELVTIAAGGAGSLTATQTYKWKITFEAMDASGHLHRSTPAEVNLTIGGANGSADIVVPYNHLSTFTEPTSDISTPYAKVVFYRTTGNGVLFFERQKTDMNLPGSASLAFNDATADSILSTKPYIYTTGELENVPPPAFYDILAYKNRIFGIDDTRRAIWYSKKYVPGIAPGFHDTFQIPITETGGLLTCLAAMDDKLVVFATNKIYFITGDGPTPNGANTSFGEPNAILSDVGCSEPRSVVTGPDGVYFQGTGGGIYLLDRGLNVKYIGKPVEQTAASYPVVKGAYMDSAESIMVFECSSSETSANGVALVYNYELGTWCTHERTESGNATAAVQSAINLNGTPYLMFTDGKLFKADRSWYFDEAVAIPVDLISAWIKPAGLQGFGRVSKLGVLMERFTDDHSLVVQIANDWSSTYHDSFTFSAATLTALSNREIQITPTRQECSAFRVRLTLPNDGSASTRQGCAFTSMYAEVGAEIGPNRLVPTAQA